MRTAAKFLTADAFALLLALGAPPAPTTIQAQAGAQAPASSQPPTFRATVDLITIDMIARDSLTEQFIADLKPHEIEILEDGVKQEIVSFVLTHGGRVFNTLAPPPAPVQEGIILPQRRPTNDAAGRIFLIFIDDFHLQFRETPRTRDLIKKMLRLLIHEGDMFGIVSTGHSSISEQLTYDRQVLESSIERITGGGLTPKDIMQGMSTSQGPAELRHRAHVAFSTAYDLMRNLEKVQNRRKAVIYISSGYDFDPFVEGRLEEQARRMGINDSQDEQGGMLAAAERLREDPTYRDQRPTPQLASTALPRPAPDAAAGLPPPDPGAVRPDESRQSCERAALHNRSARPDCRSGHRSGREHERLERVRARDTGQPARACGADRRHRHRQPERLRQGAQADRQRDQRLLRAGLLLEQSGSDTPHATARSAHVTAGRDHPCPRDVLS